MSSLEQHIAWGLFLSFAFVLVNPLITVVCVFYSVLPDLMRESYRRFLKIETNSSHHPFMAFFLTIPLYTLIGFEWYVAGICAYLLHIAVDGRSWEW